MGMAQVVVERGQRVSPRLLLSVGLLTAIAPFSIDMYLPAFQAIAVDLGTTTARVGQTLTTFFAGIAIGQLLYGPLLDRFGRKRPLQIGLVIYILSCLACAWALTVDQLMMARGLMALGGCAGMVASRAVVRDSVPPAMTARVFSMLMLVTGLAPMVAPTIGGFLLQEAGWRSIFHVLAMIGGVMLVATATLPATVRGADPSVSLRPKAVLGTYWSVLRNGFFLRHAVGGAAALAIMFAYIAGSPFVFMELYGLSAVTYGQVFGANALALTLGGQLNAYCLRTRSAASMLRISVVAVALAVTLLLVAVLSMGSLPLWLFGGLLALVLFSMGLLPPNATALALMPFEKQAGSASALLGAIQMAMGVLATLVVSALHATTAIPMVATMAGCAAVAVGVLLFRKAPSADLALGR